MTYEAEHVKAAVRAYHASGERARDDNERLDTLLLGKECPVLEGELFDSDDHYTMLQSRYAGEEPWNGTSTVIWTPYNKIRAMIHGLTLTADDTFYDLGAGYGRVPLYAGITTEATCKGIELVRERAEVAEHARQRLGLGNVEIINGNVRQTDFSDGNVFFMFNPFSEYTFGRVFRKLEQIAQDKPVTVAARARLPFYDTLQGFRFHSSIRTQRYGDPEIAVFKSHP
jgi:hypothetical protein